jgi:hypothetical protein
MSVQIEECLAHVSRGGVLSHLLAVRRVLTTFLGIAGHGSLLGLRQERNFQTLSATDACDWNAQ